MKVEMDGVEIELVVDFHGFPILTIELNGNYEGELHRPAIEINLNGVEIHPMFNHEEEDDRWNN